MKSLDLIFNEGINWSAFLTSFNRMIESNYNLSLKSIRQDNGTLIIEVITSAVKEEIESSFWTLYESIINEKQRQIRLLEQELKLNQQQNNYLMKIIEVMAEKENNPTLQDAHFAGGFAGRDYTGDIITYNQGDKSHGDIIHNHSQTYEDTIRELKHFIDKLSNS